MVLPRYSPPDHSFLHSHNGKRADRSEWKPDLSALTLKGTKRDSVEAWLPFLEAIFWLNRNLTKKTAQELKGCAREWGTYKKKFGADEQVLEEKDKVAFLLSGRVKCKENAWRGEETQKEKEEKDSGRTLAFFREGHWLGLERIVEASLTGAHRVDSKDSEHHPLFETLSEVEVVLIPIEKLNINENLVAFAARQVFMMIGAVEGTAATSGLIKHWRGLLEKLDKKVNTTSPRNRTLPTLLQYSHRWWDVVEKTALFEMLTSDDWQLLLQLSAIHVEEPTKIPRDYQEANKPISTLSLLIHGKCQALFEEKAGHVVLSTQHDPGVLLGYEQLATPEEIRSGEQMAEEPPNRRTTLRLSARSVTLEMDWHALRWIFEEDPQLWERLRDHLAGEDFHDPPRPSTVVVFCRNGDKGMVTTLAHGTALALARAFALEEDEGDKARVCIVDIQGRDKFVNWLKNHPDQEDELRSLLHSEFHPEKKTTHRYNASTYILADKNDKNAKNAIDMVWLSEEIEDSSVPEAIHELVEDIRQLARYDFILVSAENSVSGEVRAPSKELRSALETFIGEDCVMVWLTEDPSEDYTVTDSPPRRLIRAELMTDLHKENALKRARMTMGVEDNNKEYERFQDHHAAWHVLRVPYDLKERDAFKTRASVVEFFEHKPAYELAQTFERLARMLRGRSVGVALGGGGAWGFSHIALLEALERKDVPIDYISGTSFGSLVAGLYAAGGLQALERLIEWSTPRDSSNKGRGQWRDINRQVTDSRLGTRVTAAIFGSHHLQLMVDDILRELASEKAPGRKWSPGHPKIKRVALNQAKDLLFDSESKNKWYSEAASHREVLDDKQAHNKHWTHLMERTRIPFLAISADTKEDNQEILRSGTVGLGVRFASCLPPVYQALELGDVHLLDGALIAFVPAGETRKNGADFVIASNAIPTESKILEDYEKNSSSIKTILTRRRKAQIERLLDFLKGFYMMSWKAGQDEGQQHANYIVQMRPENFEIFHFWRGADIKEYFMGEMKDVSTEIKNLYDNPSDWLDEEAWSYNLDDDD